MMEIEAGVRVVQVITFILYITLLALELRWMVEMRNSHRIWLAVPISMLALHGIVYYICLFLNEMGMFPSNNFFYWLFSFGVRPKNAIELFTQWSAVLRAQGALSLLALSVGRNYLLRYTAWTTKPSK